MSQIRLLIIEDDPDQRDLMKEILLDRFGPGTVWTAGSSAEAMAMDLSSFDLVLADYNLPDASGMDVLDAIRRKCDIPLIMVTGENVGDIAAEAIRRGATDYVVKVGDYLFTIPLVVEKNLAVGTVRRENERLRKRLEDTLLELQLKNAQLEESLKRMEQISATDPLTGLYNRRHFGRVLGHLFAEAQRYGSDLACAMIDLDGYKQLNDTHGHLVGDQLLMMAGRIISTNMRQMDIAARYGGDEFVLLLPHASADDAERVAERIGQEFRTATASLLERAGGVSMSVGVASLVEATPVTADQLVALADTALYQAKDAGRNRITRAAREVSALSRTA